MEDNEVLCSLTEQGNLGLGIGEVTNKKDQEAIRSMQKRQKELSEQSYKCSRSGGSCSSHSSHYMDD